LREFSAEDWHSAGGSALEACLGRCAVQIDAFFSLLPNGNLCKLVQEVCDVEWQVTYCDV